MKPAEADILSRQLQAALGHSGPLVFEGSVPGGDINQAVQASFGAQALFIKLNHHALGPMFEAEFQALEILGKSKALRFPVPICHGQGNDHAWLVMEHITLRHSGDAQALGRGLAALHRCHGPRYGWPTDNWIGTTVQENTWCDDWPSFWWRRRIDTQVQLAMAAGYPASLRDRADQLAAALPGYFSGHKPAPSLLHGDLWGGNHGYAVDGLPVLFDPASYYGDRETDLAMTELFGGFDPGFMKAYQAEYPLPAAYNRRRPLYQLYHLLNHLNLFGRGWLGRVQSLLDELIGGPG
jgi:fructosamine-3-kinase